VAGRPGPTSARHRSARRGCGPRCSPPSCTCTGATCCGRRYRSHSRGAAVSGRAESIKSKDCHGRRPGNMVEAVFRALLRVVRQQRSTCAYMRRHAPRPWHQLAYEDLDNSTSRAQAIAAIYRHVGVHDSWTGWHDVRRRQSSREADAISLFLGRGRVRPVGRAHPAGPEPAARQPRQTFIHRPSRVPVCGVLE